MPDLMGQHGGQFRHGLTVDQGVEQGDPLRFPEPREKSIGFAGALRAIDHIDLIDGKVLLTGQIEDRGFELPILQTGKLVEQGHDPDRSDPGHEKGQQRDGHPSP